MKSVIAIVLIQIQKKGQVLSYSLTFAQQCRIKTLEALVHSEK